MNFRRDRDFDEARSYFSRIFEANLYEMSTSVLVEKFLLSLLLGIELDSDS